MLAPVNAEEFCFCVALMDAAASGKMPTRSPSERKIPLKDGELAFKDIPINRAMLAVGDHFHATHKNAEPSEFMSLTFRLMEMNRFISTRFDRHDPRLRPLIQIEDGRISGLHPALVESFASADIGARGFKANSVFATASNLLAKYS